MSSSALHLAIAAADRGLWPEVIERLQAISLDDITVRNIALDLALQVLTCGDFEQQWEIAKIVPKLGEIVIQPLLTLLNDQEIENEDRWFAARILGSFDRPEVIVALVGALRQDEDLELSEIATGALAKIGRSAIAALAGLLATPDCQVAVTALAQIRHSQTIEPLLGISDHADPQIRMLTVEALGSFHDPRIPPLLLAKLRDPAPGVRRVAVVALGLRSELAIELELVRQLRPLLFDLNLGVCAAAALSLARLPDPDAVDVLADMLADPRTPPALRSPVILALGWIGTRSALDRLAQSLATAPVPEIAEIVRSISNTESESTYASQLLTVYLSADLVALPAIVKQEIAAALGNLGNIDSVPELIQLLGDPDDRVKLYTIAAIAKLAPTIPAEILQLSTRSDLPAELQLGVRMCLAHWQLPATST